MGLLDNLLNRNPTRDWQAQRGLELVLDVDGESLSGITIGDTLARLAKFGPAEDAAAARLGIYRWGSKGFDINVEQERVAEMAVHFYDHERFRGTVKLGGRQLPAGPVKEQDIVALLGAPAERDVREDEGLGYRLAVLRYERKKAHWLFEFDGEGVLESIWAGKPD